jgi:hypothetical protein
MVAEFVRTVMDVMSRESPPRGEDCQCIYRLRVEITGVFDELKAKMADLRLPEAEDQARVDDGDQNSNPAVSPIALRFFSQASSLNVKRSQKELNNSKNGIFFVSTSNRPDLRIKQPTSVQTISKKLTRTST